MAYQALLGNYVVEGKEIVVDSVELLQPDKVLYLKEDGKLTDSPKGLTKKSVKFKGQDVIGAVAMQFISKYADDLKETCVEVLDEFGGERDSEPYLYFYYSVMHGSVQQDWNSADRGLFNIGKYDFEEKTWEWCF